MCMLCMNILCLSDSPTLTVGALDASTFCEHALFCHSSLTGSTVLSC